MVLLHILYLQQPLSIPPLLILLHLPLPSVLRSGHLTLQPPQLLIEPDLPQLLLTQQLIVPHCKMIQLFDFLLQQYLQFTNMTLHNPSVLYLIALELLHFEFQQGIVLRELVGFEVLPVMNLGIGEFQPVCLQLPLVDLSQESVVVAGEESSLFEEGLVFDLDILGLPEFESENTNFIKESPVLCLDGYSFLQGYFILY